MRKELSAEGFTEQTQLSFRRPQLDCGPAPAAGLKQASCRQAAWRAPMAAHCNADSPWRVEGLLATLKVHLPFIHWLGLRGGGSQRIAVSRQIEASRAYPRINVSRNAGEVRTSARVYTTEGGSVTGSSLELSQGKVY